MTLPKTPSFRLDGKRALVAGASSGIGLACAVAMAEAGAHVTLAARRVALLDEVVSELLAAGHSADATALDISDTDAAAAFIADQAPYDVLVNSAGLARHGTALDANESDFDAVVAVNLKGAFFLSRNVARSLIDAGKSGSIINISSQMAVVGGPERSVYCATKHGVEGFTKAMAIEWGKHSIRINSVLPTFIRTALTEVAFSDTEKMKWINSMIKLPRVGEVEDIMGPVTFLASDASALITGTSLLVDGGWTAE